MASLFDHINPKDLENASPDALDFLKKILLGMAVAAAEDQPEESAVEAHLIDIYNRLDDALHASFRKFCMPIDPRIEGGKELQKALLPSRKAFLELTRGMLEALEKFPEENPMPEIPQIFIDRVQM